MPSCVLLKNSSKIIIVKSFWCRKLSDAECLNAGFLPCDLSKIFFSPGRTAEANFKLKARPASAFTVRRTACYYGAILKLCGMRKKKNKIANSVVGYINFESLHCLFS